MEKVSSKKVVMWTITILVLIISVVGFSFAFFFYSRTSDTDIKIRSGGAMFGYQEETNGITVENMLPTEDEVILNTENEDYYFDFYVTYNFSEESHLSYEIDIEDTTDQLESIQNGMFSRLDSSRIKVALENRTVTLPDEPMVVNPVYFSSIEQVPASNSKRGYQLYHKETSGYSIDYYRLYMWIPEYDAYGDVVPVMATNGNKGIENQQFSVKINVQAVSYDG